MLRDIQRMPINHDGAIGLIHLERESKSVRPKSVGKLLLWLQTQPKRCPRESKSSLGPQQDLWRVPLHPQEPSCPHRELTLPAS